MSVGGDTIEPEKDKEQTTLVGKYLENEVFYNIFFIRRVAASDHINTGHRRGGNVQGAHEGPPKKQKKPKKPLEIDPKTKNMSTRKKTCKQTKKMNIT